MSFEQTRKVRLTTIFGWLAAAFAAPYLFVFSNQGLPLRSLIVLFIAICGLSVYLNKCGRYNIARNLLFSSATLLLFVSASAFGRAAGEQLIYVPIIFAAVLLYDISEIKQLIFAIILILACWITLEITNYSLFDLGISPEQQLEYYYGNMVLTFAASIIVSLLYFKIYAQQNISNETQLKNARETEAIINYFATSLYRENTVDQILWDIAKNCISKFGFQDCVIYLLNEETNHLEQRAAYGPKNPVDHEITNCIQVPVGKGVVGYVAQTGKPELVPDTTRDDRYILDEKFRYSELAVPILYQNKVIGVIDSEHDDKNFFNTHHLNLLTTIAALGANKIMRAIAEEEKIKASSQQKQMEQIRQLEGVKARFFNQMSHEFRTPLTLILGLLNELKETCRLADQQAQLKIIQDNAHLLLQLINELIQLAKITDKLPVLESRQVNFSRLMHGTMGSLEPFALQKNVTVENNIPEKPLVMSLDEGKIEMLLINLLSNALMLSPEGQIVQVDTVENNDAIEVTVSGNAPDPEVVAQTGGIPISLKTETDGYGIGLELAKKLAAMHDGHLEVAFSETRYYFRLTMPLDPGRKEDPEQMLAGIESLRNSAEGNAKRIDFEEDNKNPLILIVEDSDYLRDFLYRILQNEFDLVQASDGEDGLKKSILHVPDLIISDIMMPKMDGLELCKKAKEMEVTSHIPVVLLTALADFQSKLNGLETGADYYLPKPFEPRELLTVTHNLIQHRKKMREHYSKKIVLRSQHAENMSADDRFLQRLIQLIEDNISDPDFKVEDLQKDLGISRMQLHRKLKALTNKSATEFMRTIRLKKAADMLRTGQDNVSQVAYQVGFNSLSYFTKCFKEQFGVPPSGYPPADYHVEKKSSTA